MTTYEFDSKHTRVEESAVKQYSYRVRCTHADCGLSVSPLGVKEMHDGNSELGSKRLLLLVPIEILEPTVCTSPLSLSCLIASVKVCFTPLWRYENQSEFPSFHPHIVPSI